MYARSPGTVPPPIDPFHRSTAGVYRDGLVEVTCLDRPWDEPGSPIAYTTHFEITEHDGRLRLAHRMSLDRINADLAGLMYEELFSPGWLRGAVLLERLVTGVVLTVDDDPLSCWELFYRNTLAEIDRRLRQPEAPRSHLGDFAPVYGHAQELVTATSTLELGCSLGFLSLRLARTGLRVIASDINPGSVRLLERVAPRLRLPLSTQLADAARYPATGPVAGTVLAVHLLEHVDDETGERILAEAIRLATEQVIVAVPFERVADVAWGHVRTFDLDALTAIGRRTGYPFDAHEYHGGWLAIDLR